MKILVKEFDVEMELKNKGMEFEVRDPDGTSHLGDVLVNKKGFIWCRGKTSHQKGIKKSWKEFISRLSRRGRISSPAAHE